MAPKTSPWSMICPLALASCGTTPIEVVAADENCSRDASETSTKCSEPAADRFTLSAENAYLRRGAPTAAAIEPAFMSELSVDCTSTRAQWALTPAVAGTFTLRNAETQLALDVRAGSDVPGTPIIVYDPNTLDNQRFWFRPRANGTYERSMSKVGPGRSIFCLALAFPPAC